MPKYTVQQLYESHGEDLSLDLVAGEVGIKRRIEVPEVHRPGLILSGYGQNHAKKRIVAFGREEIRYLRDQEANVRKERVEMLLSQVTPAVIVSRRLRPVKELRQGCNERGVPLFRTPMSTMNVISRLTYLLSEEFAPSINCHGSLVEVFGIGVLIRGDSAVGKSEAALGLIERGHRLISDDIVRVCKREGSQLEGHGVDLTRHHMEIRGIGIINVAHLYGAVCVRDSKSIDLVVNLEAWDDQRYYDRAGIQEKTCTILGVQLPYHVLPVKPGRDVVLMLETLALNARLKEMGYNSAREFNQKLLEAIAKKEQAKRGRQGARYAEEEANE